jgi:hypothetical protein
MPSFRRTSTGTEICPCAVTFERAIAIPNITMVMERVGLHEPSYAEVRVGSSAK